MTPAAAVALYERVSRICRPWLYVGGYFRTYTNEGRRAISRTRLRARTAFFEEACSRGVRRIWVTSYDFQAPGMFKKSGFKRMAEFEGWPEGYINVVLCKAR